MDTAVGDAVALKPHGIEAPSDVEPIAQSKGRYCRYLDTKNWEAWHGIFADDFVGDTSESAGDVITAADAHVAYTRGHIGKTSQPTVHHVHAREIVLPSPITAAGLWARQDVVRIAQGLNLRGLGRLGPKASLPGDPADDRGWSFTGWFDTTESQALLEYQRHDWATTVRWVAESQATLRVSLRMLGPVLRPVMRTALAAQRRLERRDSYADPWTLIASEYGPEVLARGDESSPK